jgi:protein-tyrosine phosphatase
MSYVELHFHLLAGVDDGPASIEESVALAAAAAAQGTSTIVATPHVSTRRGADPLAIGDRVRELRERLAAERVGVSVLPGGELDHGLVGRLSQRELEAIANGPRGARWLLVESPLAGFGPGFTAATEELRRRGFGVVLAHPERARGAGGHAWRRTVMHELDRGSVLQVNAWSLAGRHGDAARDAACELLRSRQATVVASDAHGRRRPPGLPLAIERARATGLSVGDARQLAAGTPRRLLAHGLSAPPFAAAA